MREIVMPIETVRLDRLYGWSLLAIGAALCCSLLVGCGHDVPTSAPVKSDVARETLSSVMESWKNGAKPESLQERNPAIVVQDLDWTGGFKLVDYDFEGLGKEVDANLIVQVKLTLEDSSGEKTEKMVTYVVGTSPKLTVFRDFQ